MFALLCSGLLVDSGLGREYKLEGSSEPGLVSPGIRVSLQAWEF